MLEIFLSGRVYRGAETRGGWRVYPPNNLTVSPPIIWVWSTSASPPIIWLWCASERRSPPEFGEKSVPFSSVARGGVIALSPLACQPKCRIRKIPRFYHFWDCLCWNGLKSDLKHLLKHIFRGTNLSTIKVTNQWKLRKMPKNKQSNFIATVKMPKISFINKHIINSEIRGKGGLFSIT